MPHSREGGPSKETKSKSIMRSLLPGKKSKAETKTNRGNKSVHTSVVSLPLPCLEGHAVMSREWLLNLAAMLLEPNIKMNLQFAASDVHLLLQAAIKDCKGQQTLVHVESPLSVVGDIHGQLTDLRRILYIRGMPSTKRYLFLGDYVDRGSRSIEVAMLLLTLRQLFPRNFFLLRGNHEIAHINAQYGFKEAVMTRFGEEGPEEAEKIYDHFNEVFSWLPLAAVIKESILCMHGGISSDLKNLNDITNIARPIVKPKGIAQDILWADPEKGAGFEYNNTRNCSVKFGEKNVQEKCELLGVQMIVRAHQLVDRGYSLFASRSLITIFSATRYGDGSNYGGVVDVNKNLECRLVLFKPVEEGLKKQDEITADDSEPKTKQSSKSKKKK